jgi:hypothetical protein
MYIEFLFLLIKKDIMYLVIIYSSKLIELKGSV